MMSRYLLILFFSVECFSLFAQDSGSSVLDSSKWKIEALEPSAEVEDGEMNLIEMYTLSRLGENFRPALLEFMDGTVALYNGNDSLLVQASLSDLEVLSDTDLRFRINDDPAIFHISDGGTNSQLVVGGAIYSLVKI